MSTETPDETIAHLTERNRKLANQIVGYGDRMQQTIAGIVRDAKVEALREAADDQTLRLSGHSGISITRLRTRADNLEAS